MSVTVTNLLQGPATLYHAAFGAAEPANASVALGVGWTDLGGTSDGVTSSVELGYTDKSVDQVVDMVGATFTSRNATISTNLAEATLENWARSQNELVASAITDGVYTPGNGVPGEPNYSAIALKGLGPSGKPRLVIVRRALQVANVESAHKKDGMQLLPVQWKAYYVSASIAPFVVIDKQAA